MQAYERHKFRERMIACEGCGRSSQTIYNRASTVTHRGRAAGTWCDDCWSKRHGKTLGVPVIPEPQQPVKDVRKDGTVVWTVKRRQG